MISRDDIFYLPHHPATTREDLFTAVAELLEARDYVKPGYAQALADREVDYPTGLPFPGGVAIPHTSADHVLADGFVIVTPTTPVQFHEMGGDEEDTVDAGLVIVLVVSDPTNHVKQLSKLIKSLQREDFRTALREAPDTPAAQQVLGEALNIPLAATEG